MNSVFQVSGARPGKGARRHAGPASPRREEASRKLAGASAPAPLSLFETAVCQKCGVEQPIEAFPVRNGKRFSTCKHCMPQYKKGGSARRHNKRTWQRENREKRLAHKAVEYALLRGDLIRPSACSVCGATGRIESHHEDYSKPLEVVWLCSSCHYRANRINGTNPRRNTSENTRRSVPKTHCVHGHPLSGSNLIIDKRGHRVCRTCKLERQRRWEARTCRIR